MLDLRVVSSGGGTSLTSIGTIAVNDNSSVAGVPIADKATLMMWGGLTTIADTIAELKMSSQDQVDPINGEDYYPGASSLLGMFFNYANLPYKTGKRLIQMTQNTGAANNLGFTLDHYAEGPCVKSSYVAQDRIILVTTFSALTAITFGSAAFAPTTAIPNGKYAILGAWVNGLTNYALIRFAHADFLGKEPGFPVVDRTNTALANAVDDKDIFLNLPGYQFVYLSEKTGVNCCPVFTVTNAGTGLIIKAIAITTDTPKVILNIAKIG